MERLPLSAFVICQDEEAVIEGCIRCRCRCREVVVDSGSTDGTLGILGRLRDEGWPLRIVEDPWRGYGAQKQFALDLCQEPWCLSIHSDDRMSPTLDAALARKLGAEGVAGWAITRFPYLTGFGYVPPRAHERYHNRLFRRGLGRFDPEDRVHEGIRVEGEMRRAGGAPAIPAHPYRGAGPQGEPLLLAQGGDAAGAGAPGAALEDGPEPARLLPALVPAAWSVALRVGGGGAGRDECRLFFPDRGQALGGGGGGARAPGRAARRGGLLTLRDRRAPGVTLGGPAPGGAATARAGHAGLSAGPDQEAPMLDPDVDHGFHTDSTPRYDEEAATLAWDHTLAFFEEHLREG